MTLRLRPTSLIAFAVTTTVYVGCGSDDRLTADEYFQGLQAISDRADERFEPLGEGINQDFASESEEIAAWREFFAADLEIVTDYLEEVRALKPPAEIDEEHEQFIEAGAELLQAISKSADIIGNLQSKAEPEQLLDSPALEEPTNRFDSACRQLQEAADTRGIEVDLDCE